MTCFEQHVRFRHLYIHLMSLSTYLWLPTTQVTPSSRRVTMLFQKSSSLPSTGSQFRWLPTRLIVHARLYWCFFNKSSFINHSPAVFHSRMPYYWRAVSRLAPALVTLHLTSHFYYSYFHLFLSILHAEMTCRWPERSSEYSTQF